MSPPAASLFALRLNSRAARFFSSATSSSVRNCRPSNCFGRSKGVALTFSQTPCKSGLPSGVIGGVHCFV